MFGPSVGVFKVSGSMGSACFAVKPKFDQFPKVGAKGLESREAAMNSKNPPGAKSVM